MPAQSSSSISTLTELVKASLTQQVENRKDLQYIKEKLDSTCAKLEDHEKAIGLLEAGQARREAQITGLQADVGSLEKKSENWSVINTVGVFIAGLLGIFGISR